MSDSTLSTSDPSTTKPVMEDEGTDLPKTKKERFRGHVIYGLRQTFFCFVTDFIDPVVGGWFQGLFGSGGRIHEWMEKDGGTQARLLKNRKIADWTQGAGNAKDARTRVLGEELLEDKKLAEWLDKEGSPEAKHIAGKLASYETPTKKLSPFQHALRGEVVGDISALGVYLAAKYYLSKPVDAIIAKVQIRQARHSPELGKIELREWAEKHGIREDDPRYVKRLEEFRQTKAEGTVDSAIIAGSSLVLNVVAQKLGGNDKHWTIVAGGKLVGTIATLAVMLGLDALVPRTMRTFDHEIDKKYFERGLHWVKSKFGHHEAEPSKDMPTTEQKSPQRFELTPEERTRLNARPKSDFRARSFAQPTESPVRMSM